MKRKITQTWVLCLALVIVFGMFGVTQSPVADAQSPTATPNDPVWLSFETARTALEDELQRNIRFVASYTWEEAEFAGGITDCKALDETEQPEFLFFGYRFNITLLNGSQYEVRTSFNNQIVVVCDNVTQVAAAQAAANPDLPAPVANSGAAGGFEVGGQVTGLFPEAIAAIQSAGMTWVKIQAKEMSVDQATAFINEAHANNLKILLSAVGDHNRVMDPAYQDQWVGIVAQYAANGADAIEVWNEPNIEREWQTGQVNGANYTALLAKAFNAIKAANPNTIVISGATAPTGFFGAAGCTENGCNDDVFYQQMAAAGAAQYMDCVGVHYNEGIVGPTQNTGDPRDNYPTRYYQSNLGRAIGPFPGMPACFTEIGYLTSEGYGPLPGGFAWAANTTLAQHAQWLGEAVDIAQASGNVRLFIVFNVNFTLYGEDPQAGFAIIRPGGGCPACDTIRNAISN